MFKSLGYRYLLAGFINVCIGYLVGVCFYIFLHKSLHIALIAVLINIVTISFSFVTYKLFVFKTQGHWIKEYFRSYIVYGSSALISIFTLWFLIDNLKMNIYIVQAATISITVAASYFGHRYFTFIK